MIKLVSGGQSGVDRAALDFAIRYARPYGGWCPRGGLAEDYPDPPGLLRDYPRLRETSSSDYMERTDLNVRDSDATLIIALRMEEARSGGTGATQRFAEQRHKAFFVACLDEKGCCDKARRWLDRQQQRKDGLLTINVAGPRLSKSPDVYKASLTMLEELLGKRGG